MNVARDFGGWLKAMEMQAIPSFHVVYADRNGTIGYFYNAAIPMRAAGNDWSKTSNGADPHLVWKGVRPFGAAPRIVNPKSGYVVNANNQPFEASAPEDNPKPEDFPPEFGIDRNTTNRGLREQELYGADASISAEEFISYKMDHFFSRRSRLVALIDSLIADKGLASDPETKAAIALLKTWDRSAAQENRAAALAIRTGRLALGWYLSGEFAKTPDPRDALIEAADELKAAFGRIDPTWGEAMRLKRGAVDLAVNGAPETLRAVYPHEEGSDGPWSAAGGDTYILYADWPAEGAPDIRTIHQFGAATQDATSRHYADQAPLFAAEKWKSPPMTLEALLKEATADYRPGDRR
jgi:penicillin amidase/acyl-homoserine-lactone acylase